MVQSSLLSVPKSQTHQVIESVIESEHIIESVTMPYSELDLRKRTYLAPDSTGVSCLIQGRYTDYSISFLSIAIETKLVIG